MLRELPSHTTAIRLPSYEHLDVLWGQNVDEDVIPHVIAALRSHCIRPDRLEKEVKMANGLTVVVDPSGYTTPADSMTE